MTNIEMDPGLFRRAAAVKECALCFDPGKTPHFTYACLTGIQIGNNWIAADPPPPNGVFECVVDLPCEWRYADIDWDFEYFAGNPNATLKVLDKTPVLHFNGVAANPCDSWFANTIVNPVGTKYYGGFAVMVYREPADCTSMSDLMTLLNMDVEPGTWAVPRPKIGDETVSTIARLRDATNIKILHETT